jgi:hypothetical protein
MAIKGKSKSKTAKAVTPGPKPAYVPVNGRCCPPWRLGRGASVLVSSGRALVGSRRGPEEASWGRARSIRATATG